MKRLFLFLIKPAFIFPFLAILLMLTTKVSWAQQDCFDFQIIFPFGELIEEKFDQIEFEFYVRDPDSQYLIRSSDKWPYQYDSGWVDPGISGKIYPKAIRNEKLLKAGKHILKVERKEITGDYCSLSYTVLPSTAPSLVCKLTTSSTGDPGYTSSDTISVTGTDVPSGGDIYKVTVNPSSKEYQVTVSGNSFSHTLGKFNNDNYTVTLSYLIDGHPPRWERANCQTVFKISSTGGGETEYLFDPCAGATGRALEKCQDCLGFECNEEGKCKYTLLTEKSWTALGCIPTDPSEFVAWVLSFAIKIGGGIAFLLMLWGGFQIMTSSGDPEKLNQGKSIITSAISGLILIIFSVLLLKVIGIEIFELPGFGK